MSSDGGTNVDQIRERAFRLWQEDGCPEGRSLEYWFRAETELAGEAAAGEATHAAATAPAPMEEPAQAPERGRRRAKSGDAAAVEDAGSRGEAVQQKRTRRKAEG
jgi:hypothetical protein